ncbi:monoglyceride lipase-like [Amblyomma americanum]
MSWPTPALNSAPANSFKVEDATFVNGDGYKIFTRAWIPRERSRAWKALVFMCHGYLEHCHVPNYDILATVFVAEGCYVFTHDLVGHGKSDGTRAAVKSFDKYVDGILEHADSTRKKFWRKPVYLFGHSLGGLLVAMAVQRRPVDFAGIVMTSPLIAPHKALTPWYKRIATKILGRVLPSAPVAALDLTLCARDPQVVAYMRNDPLRYHGTIPLGWVASLYRAQDDFIAKLNTIEVPMFVLVASDDRVCDVGAMKQFFDSVPSKHKKIKIYEGSYHQILAEPEGIKEQAFMDIAEWFKESLYRAKVQHSYSQSSWTSDPSCTSPSVLSN